MNTEFIFPVRVYVEDTDFGGIVYHSVYLNYLERCRTEWLNHLGLDLLYFANNDCYFVVRHIDIQYQKAARLNMMLAVTAKVHEIGRTSITFVQTVQSPENPADIYCQAQVKLVTINAAYKPIRLPSLFVEKIK